MYLSETANPEWWSDPANVAELFLMLIDGEQQTDLLDFVTPESEALWGDFSEAKEFLNSIENPALVRPAQTHSLASDVVFVALLSSDVAFEVDDESIMLAAGWVTLVWREEFKRWLVSHFEIGRGQLEDIARTKH